MDITYSEFFTELPSILQHVIDADFVAFDLELSGIPLRQNGKKEGEKTLQDRYSECKEAAEKFHIIQVGLTFVKEDAGQYKYYLRRYNFNLSPVLHEDFDVEREWVFSGSAVNFLLRQGYDMKAPFAIGIPYLKPLEVASAEQGARRRYDRSQMADMRIASNDTRARALIERVIDEVNIWSTEPDRETIPLIIKGSGGEELTPFERRLVHQTVRKGYPDLTTSSLRGFVAVREYSRDERKADERRVQERVDEAILDQTGFRWVMDALVSNGDLSELPRRCTEQWRPVFDRAAADIRKKRTTLVGHNCFMDLVFIFNQFYGHLPDTVSEFAAALNAKFPVIYDTKFLASAGPDGGYWRNTSLEIIFDRLNHIGRLELESLAGGFEQTNAVETPHEAGYDSWMTATVFLKAATILQDGKTLRDATFRPPTLFSSEKHHKGASSAQTALGNKTVEPVSTERPDAVSKVLAIRTTKPKKTKKVKNAAQSDRSSRYGSSGKFGLLSDLQGMPGTGSTTARKQAAEATGEDKDGSDDSDDDDDDDNEEQKEGDEKAMSHSKPGPTTSQAADAASAASMLEAAAPPPAAGFNPLTGRAPWTERDMLPPTGHPSWDKYANRLRVFGLQGKFEDQVCDLDALRAEWETGADVAHQRVDQGGEKKQEEQEEGEKPRTGSWLGGMFRPW